MGSSSQNGTKTRGVFQILICKPTGNPEENIWAQEG